MIINLSIHTDYKFIYIHIYKLRLDTAASELRSDSSNLNKNITTRGIYRILNDVYVYLLELAMPRMVSI